MEHFTEKNDDGFTMEHVINSTVDTVELDKIYRGEVVTIDNEFAYVNVGTKSDGRISLEEFSTPPEVGDMIEIMLVNKRLIDGMYVFSMEAAEKEKKWQEFLEWYGQGNNVINGSVKTSVQKGLIVDCDIIEAFLPFSQCADVRMRKTQNGQPSAWFKIRNVDKKKKSVILSRRDYIDEEEKKIWDKLESEYKVGDIIKGKITKFVDFGAFVDVGGVEGLLHRNDISWKKVFKKKKIINVGEERDFVILGMNREEGKISLGLKQLSEDPWLSINDRYNVGDRVTGKVVTLTNFGMFVEIEDGIEGFVSASDLSWTKRNENPKDLYRKGEDIEVVIQGINEPERKLSLGIKQLTPNPWNTVDERFPVGTVLTRPVKKIVNFGMFVELEDDIDGLIHISDVSWDENIKDLSSLFNEGDEVEFKIIDINKREMKIACGMKQLTRSPWEAIAEKYPPRTVISGEVTSIVSFGLFVKLDNDDVEGLVHISEVSSNKIDDLEDYFSTGDKVNAVVLDVDVEKKRLSLSIKHYDKIAEKEELKKILDQTSPGKVTLGDMVKIKLDQ
ncbi:MAG: S1 RNA-binding domain-containing protein [Spirochaetota bacterium]